MSSEAQLRTAPGRLGEAPSRDPGPRWRSERMSLLWRVFVANLVLAVVAVALLAWTPMTVHRVATPRELAALAIGLALMLAADFLLLRRVFSPLQRLVALMSAVRPAEPGRRADVPRGAGREVTALAEALNAMLDRLEGERRESARRALAAQEAERQRIARELHDEIGQALTAITLRAERAAARAGEQDEALAEIARTSLQSLADVQRIGAELRPEALDDLGLVDALIVLCSRLDGQGDLRVRADLDRSLPPMQADVELVVYRVAQEALTNALRHSHGREATLSLRCEDGCVRLSVRDDGVGLEGSGRQGGLRGMHERALLVGADLEVGSRGSAGTEVRLRVPMPRASG